MPAASSPLLISPSSEPVRNRQVMFERYRMDRLLGRGGMGVVWLAHDERLDRRVALKFLPEVLFLDPSSRDDLKREARRSLELTHANIVRIYDFVEDSDNAAISMEYIDGATLSHLRTEREARCFEPDELLGWTTDLLRALDYAHRDAGFVHRDLKPSNLMVTTRGVLKVADFGISCGLQNTAARVSAWNSSGGTLSYMSPQQLQGELAAITDDVYSVGATLYELLTGKPPFHSGDISYQIRSVKPDPVNERRAKLGVCGEPIPPDWEATIAACLAKNPRERPADAREIARRLGIESLAPASSESTEELTVVFNPEAGAHKSRPARRFSIPPRLGLLGMAALLLLFVVWLMQAMVKPRPAIATAPPRASISVAPQIARGSASNAADFSLPHDRTPTAAADLEPSAVISDAETEPAAALPAESGPFLPPTPVPAVPDPVLAVNTAPAGMRFHLFAGLAENSDAPALREGETPAIIEGLAPGVYRIVFSSLAWAPYSEVIEIKDQKLNSYAHEFPFAMAHIESAPAGAQIFIGATAVGEAPLDLPLAPGRYTIKAAFANSSSAPRTVQIVANQNLRVKLEPPSSRSSHPVRATKKKPEENVLKKLGDSIRSIFTSDTSKKAGSASKSKKK